jgi:four helix bundle protein
VNKWVRCTFQLTNFQNIKNKMAKIQSYRDLIVWQKAMVLTYDMYCETKKFPKEEVYGLTSQIRRCSVSIPSNIAEGFGRNSNGDFKRFLNIATGSLYELQTQIEIAKSLEYFSAEIAEELSHKTFEIEKMINSLNSKIAKS